MKQKNYDKLASETIENIVKPLEPIFLSAAKEAQESGEAVYNLKKEDKWRFFNYFYDYNDDIRIQYDYINVGRIVDSEDSIELTLINYGDGEDITKTIKKDEEGKISSAQPDIKNAISYILKRLRDNPRAEKERGNYTYL